MATCTLMFSGGRDSTLSAVRLARQGHDVVLVTVTSGHLVGIADVRSRLVELKPLLSPSTKWLQVRQPEIPRGPAGAVLLRSSTCLPCHRSYTAVGAAMAKRHVSTMLAFGYARYQADWAEQTPYALQRLTEVLLRAGITLLTPVADVASKNDAIVELRALGLSSAALEQKCLQQQFNAALPPDQLREEIDRWAEALNVALGTVAYDESLLMAQLSLADL